MYEIERNIGKVILIPVKIIKSINNALSLASKDL